MYPKWKDDVWCWSNPKLCWCTQWLRHPTSLTHHHYYSRMACKLRNWMNTFKHYKWLKLSALSIAEKAMMNRPLSCFVVRIGIECSPVLLTIVFPGISSQVSLRVFECWKWTLLNVVHLPYSHEVCRYLGKSIVFWYTVVFLFKKKSYCRKNFSSDTLLALNSSSPWWSSRALCWIPYVGFFCAAKLSFSREKSDFVFCFRRRLWCKPRLF